MRYGRAVVVLPALLIGVLCSFGPTASLAQAANHPEYVWWQAEKPATTNFPSHCWLSASTPGEKAKLSGGQWLAFSGKATATPLYATYNVQVLPGGRYHFWVRKCWQYGPFKWRFDHQPWRICTNHEVLINETPVRPYFPADWVNLGRVTLLAGTHRFKLVQLTPPGQGYNAAYDCFALVRGAFFPQGHLRPGQSLQQAMPGWFCWNPTPTQPNQPGGLNLRYLNEQIAGEHGYVRREDGHFVLGSGQPVRFWGVDVGNSNTDVGHAYINIMARRLARCGVNMVRYHDSLLTSGLGTSRISLRKLHHLQYLVYALKRQGIYLDLSFYYVLAIDAHRLGLAGYKPGQQPFGLLEFDPRLQQLYRQWLTTILTTADPYNGVPLGQNPAVAIVENQNEDSLLFWTFSRKSFSPQSWHELERQYSTWLTRRYGSVAAAMNAWGHVANKRDDPAQGLTGLYSAWFMTSQAMTKLPQMRKRISDQVHFLTDTQRLFYQSVDSYLRRNLHYRGLITCSNWITADAQTLDALERYTYQPGDVMDHHGYFAGPHTGKFAAWSVAVGQSFRSRAAVLSPDAMPFNQITERGYPTYISEIGFDNPNRWRADGVMLAAAYGRLADLSGLCFFCIGNDSLVDQRMKEFQDCSPAAIGQFPAAALLFRGDMLRRGPVVFEQALTLRQLFALHGSAAAGPANMDPQWLGNNTAANGRGAAGAYASGQRFNPLLFNVGRIVRSEGAARFSQHMTNCRQYINTDAGTVKAATGQLFWNYHTGFVTLNSPQARGVIGFLKKAGRVQLGNVVFNSSNAFGAILLVAMDNRPIAQSHKMLLQVMTREKPFGFKVRNHVITAMGAGPWNIRNIAATVAVPSLPGAPLAITALDENGNPLPTAVLAQRKGSRRVVHLLPNCLYYILRR